MKVLVTGGSGFIGAALCHQLVANGYQVRVLDDNSRGSLTRLADIQDQIEFVSGDIRDAKTVQTATEGCQMVWHLAYINGTRFFYERPDEVLEVGIKGAINTIEAAIAAKVNRYILASTSEVYNTPSEIPTPESERIMIPDMTNPRFSYGGGKIASELLTLHYGGTRGLETVIFRPHNIYGANMGFEHVIPELVAKIVKLSDNLTKKSIDLPIQGSGEETRAFCYIDDAVRGILLCGEKGKAGEIYHLGTQKETSIRELIEQLGQILDININIIPGSLRPGGTTRRCPNISKLSQLGYQPQIDLKAGLTHSVKWYVQHLT
ncbi:MAG: NAD-dependent dehydratase [Candidatus Parabeggiatoa sp. nov. 3]|nr:MAG: NAD-dependent dehydratase [Gammaproteobacteria bacterium]RKZ69497.1 MAG: NAD-dependent dehydratase [Gammaproteobacteria bacterium]RKZ90111.1 MAG: NAD-dependent dehydratase [Gammaproteobacteria bacterium]